MEKATVLKKGRILYVKLYGKEWELDMPKEPKKVVTKTKPKVKRVE